MLYKALSCDFIVDEDDDMDQGNMLATVNMTENNFKAPEQPTSSGISNTLLIQNMHDLL